MTRMILLAAAGGLSLLLPAAPHAARAAPLRPFTVEESIAFADFVAPGTRYAARGDMVRRSPDGRHILAVTLRGDLAANHREATFWLFDAAQVEAAATSPRAPAPRPQVAARFASNANHDPVGDWRWSRDGQGFLFLGADDDGVRTLYRASLNGAAPQALSGPDQDVGLYDEAGGMVAYLAHAPLRANEIFQAGGPGVRDIEMATGDSALTLIFPNWLARQNDTFVDTLWISTGGPPRQVTAAGAPVELRGARLSLAPDGKSAVVTTPTWKVPKAWEAYTSLYAGPGLGIIADTPQTEGVPGHYRPHRYARLDFASGVVTPLVDAPIELLAKFDSPAAAWSPDGTQVALAGLYRPSPQAGAENLPCQISVLTLATGAADCLVVEPPRDALKGTKRRKLTEVSWSADGRMLIAQISRDGARQPNIAFRKIGERWVDAAAPKPLALKVAVTEALNDPPRLTAHVPGKPARVLLDPNPQLAQVAIGGAIPYSWRDPDGDVWSGALVTPPNYDPARRYPLVVQTHGLEAGRFLLDGPAATAFAARALAARGMLVLQVDETGKGAGTAKESELGAIAYRAAVDQLAAEGRVDPKKVGIVGWSHYGPYVWTALTREPGGYAAATSAEASPSTYPGYLMNIDYMGGTAREEMYRAQVGPKPFGEGLKVWITGVEGFNLHKVCTPVLYMANSPPALMYGWDGYAAIRAQNKPVDLVYIRNGDHVLTRPKQRLVEQGMNVDWYDFWLNDHRDPDPGKAAQYARWDKLRALPRCGDSQPSPELRK